MTTTKKRSIPTKSGGGRLLQYYHYKDGRPPKLAGDLRNPMTFPNGTQVTVSENHPQWYNRSKGENTGDIGGDFSTVKTWVKLSSSSDVRISGAVYWDANTDLVHNYTGPMYATDLPANPWPPGSESGSSALDAWGAKAVANAKPTNALVDLSVTLGELIGPGGIPRMIGRSEFWRGGIERALKGASDEYLNVEFGWKPILQDLMGFAHVVDQFRTLVKQYERDAGKVVRRKWFFEPTVTEQNSVYADATYPHIAPVNDALLVYPYRTGRVLRRRKTTTRRWFSGAFTYHLPAGYSSRGAVDVFGVEAQKLLGIQPTPETLWNLAPWSWAVDWFSSAGDVVSNISDWSTDGLVMRYGYLMENVISEDTYLWSGAQPYKTGSWPSPVVVTRESKSRRRANPFGFGLTWGGLSPRQLAIATALGISKS